MPSISTLMHDADIFAAPLTHHDRPSMWLPIIMFGWGVVMVGMGFVQNFGGLLSTRIFLGITEAGLFPGVSYFLTQW